MTRASSLLSSDPIEIRLEPLERRHDRGAFDCREASVTDYLRHVALQAQEALRAATKVAVTPAQPERILGYFTLVGIKIIDDELPDDLARRFKVRNLASGAPAILLAQLAVDRTMAGRGLGTFLLRHAVRHALSGALEVGGVALIVDAVNPEIATWYTKRVPDFRPLTAAGLRLILPMATLAAALKPGR
jgi:GNAT superfamily N-acetyltransferase